MEKRWRVLETDPGLAEALSRSLGISIQICRMLVSRGITTFDQARSFFRPSLDDLHSPWLMKDMRKAADRIIRAIAAGEKILVYGDYDVDGTTAVACMFRFLTSVAAQGQVDFYIPHRYKEGYGISSAGVAYAAENGFTLVISLDCGIKSADLIARAAGLGIDFIVCDHHLPGSDIPQAHAILNPKQSDCPYPYKELCGCGVGYKLISALVEDLGMPPEKAHEFLDLVATAIAADIVPITGENRILAFHGLKQVNDAPSPGIKALIDTSKHQGKSLNITNLVFMIAPRVNAAGRMDDARKAVLLFIETDPEKAAELAEQLQTDNTDRKEADASITVEALSLIQSDAGMMNRRSTVLFQPHWHKGVIGIVASRLIENYYRPTIILTGNGEVISGSARSIPGFNIHEGLDQCRDLLLGFGGHYFAAGMTLLPEHFEAFSQRFESIVKATVPEHCFIPEIEVDGEIQFRDITQNFHNIVSQMEPFGPGNAKPVFVARKVLDTGGSRIVKEDHVKFSLQQGMVRFSGIGFNLASKFALLERQQPVDILFHIDENDWNNTKSLQLRVIDIKRPE
jgi:single-stranded-DNA-specific exonuclease